MIKDTQCKWVNIFQKPYFLEQEWKLNLIYLIVQKANLKSAADVDRSKFAKKVDLASFKSNVDKFDIDKLKNVPVI